MSHASVGGATDGSWFITLLSQQAHDEDLFKTERGLMGNMGNCINQNLVGRKCAPPPPRPNKPKAYKWQGHWCSLNGLYPRSTPPLTIFIVLSYRMINKWCLRRLTTEEAFLLWDVTPGLTFHLRLEDQKELAKSAVPMKILGVVLRNIRGQVNGSFLSSQDKIMTQHSFERVSTPSSHSLNVGKHNLKAARADDATVPIWMWNDCINALLHGQIPRENLDKALEVLRRTIAHKWWFLLLSQSFWQWQHSGAPHLLDEALLEVGLEVLRRAIQSTWWEWDHGSRIHFWRWPQEYLLPVRDGIVPRFVNNPPRWTKAQQVPSDPRKLEFVKEKIKRVMDQGYIAIGNVYSLMNVFDVPKGKSDIRLVYDGTKSKLNECLWAPWFPLPTVESLLHCVDENTWFGDNDIGDQFLNFSLHPHLQPYCGIDITKLFPEEILPGNDVCWVRWTQAPMGVMQSPYQAAQGMELYVPNKPWIFKSRIDGTLACDFRAYVDDIRATGPSKEECWQVTRMIGSKSGEAGIQDASRKRREVSQAPGAWAGSVLDTSKGTVGIQVLQEQWDKTKMILDWISSAMTSDASKISFKQLESYRGFLVSTPVLQIVRPRASAVALYGFGDASGYGFGATLLKDGQILYRLGQWSEEVAQESSNYRELRNLIEAIEHFVKNGELENSELFLFTDNTTAEAAFYKGTSKSRALFNLVLQLCHLQMKRNMHLHVIQVSGMRMMAQGTDGLSRGNMFTGVFGGRKMLDFVPLHLTAIKQSSQLLPWIKSWYPSWDSLLISKANDWFDTILNKNIGHCLWSPPPAAAEAAVEQLCLARLKRTNTTHIIIIPRLLTLRWQKQSLKVADVVLTLPSHTNYWDVSQHEPLLLAICFPLLRSKPWRLRGTPFVERIQGSVREMSASGERGLGLVLHKFCLQAWALDVMSSCVVRPMLHCK